MAARDPSTLTGFLKLDLHIQTRFSACYIDHIRPELGRQTRPVEILRAAESAGLDAIAITDHNGGEVIDEIRELARGSGITILPGTEISTRGGHCLAIFDVDTPVDVIRDLMLAIDLPEEVWGDGFRRTERWMDEVFEQIALRGGLAIGAHVDREPRGFLFSDEKPSDKLRIYNSPHLAALEITDPKFKQRYATGADPRYRSPRACIQDSDAHAPEEVGRRPTYYRMETAGLDAIRAALTDYQHSIVHPWELDGKGA
jgi:predicted metal-dependent phosphoesterase TrpH